MSDLLNEYYNSEKNSPFFSGGSSVLGSYNIRDSLALRINIDRFENAGLFEEVYFHEYTHLQLSTSTSIGHALQYSSIFSSQIAFFEKLKQAFMITSFEAQEGAATLTQWSHRLRVRPTATIEEFITHLPPDYKDAFVKFYNINTALLPDYALFLLPIFANALGQFCLNTNILEELSRSFDNPDDITLEAYFEETANHPQRRMRELEAVALVTKNGKLVQNEKTAKTFNEIGVKAAYDQIAEQVPEICGENGLEFKMKDGIFTKESIAANDIFCRHFNHAFHAISGLEIEVKNAADVSRQFKTLLEKTNEYFGVDIPHFDMSSDMETRHDFKPEER